MMKIDRRSLLSSAALAFAAPWPALAQTAPAPAPAVMSLLHARAKTALSGVWRYILDPYDVAARKPRQRRSFWLDERETPGGPLIEYEWSSAPEITLPCDWNTAIPELMWYDGPVYFHRVFQAEARPGLRRHLVFEAVNYRAAVWLNGEEIATHEGGFTPFSVDVTDALRAGDNWIVVRADSRHHPAGLPSVDFDWKNYGGVTRPIWLVETPDTYIEDAFVRLEGEAIRVDMRLAGAAPGGQAVRIAAPELGLILRGRTDAEGRAALTARAPQRLRLWSPERPTLYDVALSAGADVVHEQIGFRRIETRGRTLLLNGEALFLRGVAMHEETIGENPTRAVSEADAIALLETAKALGCNFVRLAHYPHAAHVARAADRLGVLLWAEIPVYWEDVAYGDPTTLALARAMMTELVVRDRNRASVILWSVANETPPTPARTGFLRTVIDDVRRLDPTRLVTAALDKNVDIGGARDGDSRISVQDELGADLDVIAMNQYEAWYSRRSPGDIFDEVTFSTVYDKPLVMSEFGADALAGHRGARSERWTEDYQAWLFEETLRCVDRDGFAGVCPWLLKDFRSPRRWHGRFQQMWNRKGVISERGVRKQAFDVLRAYYQRKAGG
ncbi:MAG: glycoside hydrolase family 2 TIM barrel-domain containing protein [Hyphomonadaceae bacterium]|nr:glycoside hydrolase family 2 TIM barrel-domain containing protein [Hyphomonadaceae bacterium]